MGINFRLNGWEELVGFVLEPEFDWCFIDVVPQTPACRQADGLVHETINWMLLLDAYRDAVKSNAKILAHTLDTLMILAFQPGKNRVAREEIRPAFEGFGYLNAEFEGSFHDGRAGIRSEDVGPPLGFVVATANVHHKPDGLSSMFIRLARKSEDDVERRANACGVKKVGGAIDGFDFLEILVHQMKDFRGAGIGPMSNLGEACATEKL